MCSTPPEFPRNRASTAPDTSEAICVDFGAVLRTSTWEWRSSLKLARPRFASQRRSQTPRSAAIGSTAPVPICIARIRLLNWPALSRSENLHREKTGIQPDRPRRVSASRKACRFLKLGSTNEFGRATKRPLFAWPSGHGCGQCCWRRSLRRYRF